jgi:glutamate dehydrogenase (NAD(P)+)
MTDDMFRFADALGPDKIVHFTKPSVGLKGIVVVDNVAAGPAIGGTRMASDVSVEECFRLARAMTFKSAAAGLPHGGAKAVIFADPAMPAEEKERMIRAYACTIRDITDYIPGPDMGTDETAMAWVRDEIGRSVGLPREIGGIPLDEIGATGFGLAVVAEVAQDFCDMTLKGARVAIQGFGAVGKHAARFLGERGAMLVGASDSRGATANPDGIDVEELIAHKEAGHTVAGFTNGKKLGRDEIIPVSCDIWIPAARPDVLHEGNVDKLDCKMVLQGANIPATLEAEARLHERGILCVPDFIANAGGVICASVEYHGGTQTSALAAIEEKLRFNTRQVLQAAREEKLKPREAAVRLAEKRVRRAMALTRWG